MTVPAARKRPGVRGSLQTRLMVTVIGMVALILTLVGIATGAVLGRILDANLNTQLANAVSSVTVRLDPGATAADILASGRQPEGFVFVLQGPSGLSGAYVSGPQQVTELSADDIDEILAQLDRSGISTVEIPGEGDHRVFLSAQPGGLFFLAGLPVAPVTATLGQIFTTVALVTTGGLLLLGVAIAVVIRAGLRPLRTVADTASRVAAMPLSEGEVSLTARVPEDQVDQYSEIGRVGHALNTLLEHVSRSLSARQRNEERMRAFVADASHELRTPLASIRGYSELSLRAISQHSDAAGETTQASLERIQAQSLRMTALVEDLLLLARLDEGQELVFGSVDLTRLALEAVEDARPTGPDHRWILDTEPEPVVVAGDAGRLHQVAANLLANARTHTPAGTTVTVGVSRDRGDAVLSVHDDGPGIDPALAEELFERFSRADRSRARQTGGTGLGLSIARAIAEAHGGSLSVRSAPGDTTFELRLPARPSTPAP
ncbi:sensor histidine kinase [Microbacterium aurantiacum]|uniref:sensor histidine kinase n=1 Tax=Microbacterium aurantiacum TaxID=162393 RepID=UPI0027E0B05E|nr:ATP-binding protein [Microbacterium aurantiacum]